MTPWSRPPPPENSAAQTGSPGHSTEPELQGKSYHEEAATQELPRNNYGYLHRCSKKHDRAPDMSGEAWIANTTTSWLGGLRFPSARRSTST